MVCSSELTRIMVCKYLVIGCPPVSVFEISFGALPSWSRHPNRFQPRMCTAGARFHPVKIRAHIVPRQVQHLAPELPIFLNLRLGLRRSPSELAVCNACRRDPPHCRFESRV